MKEMSLSWMKKVGIGVPTFMTLLVGVSLASCSKDRLAVPDVVNPEKEANISNEERGPGIEIIFEGDLRAGGSIMGFYGDGKPVEISLQKFYPWKYIDNNERKIEYNLKADQKIYLKALGHRFFDKENPDVDLVNTSTSIEKVQLKDGKVLAYKGVINVPDEFSEDKSYSLRVRLDGGVFEEKAETFTDPLKIFPDKLPYSIYNDQDLNNWIKEVIAELKTWQSVDWLGINEDTGGTIKTLEGLKEELDKANKAFVYAHTSSYDASFEDEIEKSFFYAAIGYQYDNADESEIYKSKFHRFRKKIEAKKLMYMRQYEDLMNDGGEDADEYLMDLDKHFYSKMGFATIMAIYDVYVKDGVNKADNLSSLYQARAKAVFDFRVQTLNEYVKVCNKIQDFRFAGFKKDIWWNNNSKAYAPFRSKDPLHYAFPAEYVDRSARTEWTKINKIINEDKESFIRYCNALKAIVPEDYVDMYVIRDCERILFVDNTHQYIKRRISDGYSWKTKEVDW
ncbi:hypothetical protein [Porphyromonas levii]|uniref:hypothetical protein n=1 Tax=Porphyromonas levii TaxID=28114 RepID=UPI001B8AC6E0|nr:hypothetical protein [Porphyromonas levii]MBR8712285.1 hypothetical protein [Porphyromonas levii]MBR8714248.1 hypothetical protein [Porphyromonas levii]MBR8726790.1 hypothetical protein [Porphyromonas levii]MBR8735095.1 hypothetical protein [Porphyromonas levii]MBR8777198.1 hypothetical protein [Porphyromonas levii]